MEKNPAFQGNLTYPLEEGSLRPDTYKIPYGTYKNKWIKDCVAETKKFYENIFLFNKKSTHISEKVLKNLSLKEVIILASIIERETNLDQERPMIARVFLNRIEKGMPLQSDPTVIYGFSKGKPFQERLTRQHTTQDHPWNTYTRRGLPLTAIGLPSLASIKALIQPSQGDWLYFVASPQGGHVFSKTYEEHQKHWNIWRAYRKKSNS
jgi:UPF0755 protein